jgi:hypothetical protein
MSFFFTPKVVFDKKRTTTSLYNVRCHYITLYSVTQGSVEAVCNSLLRLLVTDTAPLAPIDQNSTELVVFVVNHSCKPLSLDTGDEENYAFFCRFFLQYALLGSTGACQYQIPVFCIADQLKFD